MRLRFLSTVSFLVLAFCAPAMAGFEFVAPVKPAAPAPAATIASPDAAPLDPVMMAPVTAAPSAPAVTDTPVDIGTMAIPLTPVVRESDALIVDSHMATSSSAVAPVESAAFAPPPANWPPEQDVAGFGRDVPLVMALQQIAPPEYRYSFDHGIDPGMRISWAGGKKWRDVVADIARDNSLAVDVVSNVIAFRRRSPMDIVSEQMADTDHASDNVMGMPIKTLHDHDGDTQPSLEKMGEKPMTLAANAPAMPVSPVVAAPVSPPVMPDPMADAPPLTGVTGVPIVLDDAAIAAKKRAEMPVTDDEIPAAEIKSRKKIMTAGEVPTRYSTNPMEIVLGGNPVPTISDAPPGVAVPNDPVLEGGDPMLVDDMPPMKKVDLTAISEWQGRKNMTLHDVLAQWASTAGISLVWSSPYDYPLQTDVRIKGTLTEAVRTMLAGFSKASPRPIGRLFKNKEVGAQPVLVVETQRLTN